MKKLHIIFWMGLYALILSSCSRSWVKVESTEPGAAVFENDSALGVTPWNGYLHTGPRHLVVEKNGVPLIDTAFTATSYRSTAFFSLWLLSIGFMDYGAITENMALAYGGAAASLGLLFYVPKYGMDHQLSLPSPTLPADTIPFWHATGMQTLQIQNRDTLFRTDSLCYEKRRQTLWTYDPRLRIRRPFATQTVARCLPGSPESWDKRPFLPFLGYGIAFGASFATGFALASEPAYDGELGREQTKTEALREGLTMGSALGATMGVILWGFSSRQEHCENQQDSAAFRKWIEQFACREAPQPAPTIVSEPAPAVAIEAPATPIAPQEPEEPSAETPSTEALPPGTRVIQFPLPTPSE